MTTYYSEDHEWITVEGDTATLGITVHAAEQLGDVVFIEQKEAEDEFEKGEEIGVIESVKAASEIVAPLDGVVVAVNEELAETPDKLNESPESDAWIYKIKISNAEQLNDLMDLAAYKALVE
jgi:glycine cleavage system H protein